MKEPRAPRKGSHWISLGFDQRSGADVYQRSKLVVLSALQPMQLPQQPEGTFGLTHHVSVSMVGGAFVPDSELMRVRRDFGMLEAEEDNHHPGRARHLMMPDDPRYRVSCECKSDEETIVMPSGYAWANPRDTELEQCRGCEYEVLLGNPCPVHSSQKRADP